MTHRAHGSRRVRHRDLDGGVVHRGARRGARAGRDAWRWAVTPTASTSIEPIEGPNYDGVRAEVTVLRDGEPIAVLHPEKRNYWVQRSTHDRGGHRTARWNMDLFAALRRGPRRGALERARAAAAAHRLRVAGGRPDGAGRRARRARSPLSLRTAAPRRRERAVAATAPGRGDVSRFIVPAVVFLVLAGVLYIGVVHSPNKSTMRRRCWASRRRRSSCRCSATRRASCQSRAARRPALGAQCLGHLVRGLPRRTRGAAGHRAAERGAAGGPRLERRRRRGQQWLKQLGNPYSVVVGRPRRAHGHRLRRVRRARNLLHRCRRARAVPARGCHDAGGLGARVPVAPAARSDAMRRVARPACMALACCCRGVGRRRDRHHRAAGREAAGSATTR